MKGIHVNFDSQKNQIEQNETELDNLRDQIWKLEELKSDIYDLNKNFIYKLKGYRINPVKINIRLVF